MSTSLAFDHFKDAEHVGWEHGLGWWQVDTSTFLGPDPLICHTELAMWDVGWSAIHSLRMMGLMRSGNVTTRTPLYSVFSFFCRGLSWICHVWDLQLHSTDQRVIIHQVMWILRVVYKGNFPAVFLQFGGTFQLVGSLQHPSLPIIKNTNMFIYI